MESAGKGIESLTNMDDRDIVERASKTKHGEKFLSLFNGESVLGDEQKDALLYVVFIYFFTSNYFTFAKRLPLELPFVMISGFLNANKMPLRRHEQIAIFYKKLRLATNFISSFAIFS